MNGKKKEFEIAKKMFKASLDSQGFVNGQKAQRILKEVSSLNPRGIVRILKIYKRLVAAGLAREEIIVESGAKIANQKKFEGQILKKANAKTVKYKINPSLVFGAKIIHGDWVYDSTLDAKLKQLTTNI